MNSIFRRILDQLLRELGLAAPPSSAPAAGPASPISPIAELDAWLKKSFAHARDLLARIKVVVKSAVGAEPNAPNAPATAPHSSPTPASDIAPPPPSEPIPAPPIVSADGSAGLEEEQREPDAIGSEERRAVQEHGSTARPARGQRTREQASSGVADGGRAAIVSEAA